MRVAETMLVRRASLGDLSAITTLERYGFAANQRWSEASWRAELIALHRMVLMTLDGQGVISVQTIAPTSDLNRVVVARSARGRGVGRALVGAGMDQARRAGCTEMLLEARADNAVALGLYADVGFEQIARRRGYYGDGCDAVILRADLSVGAPRHGGSRDE